MHMFMLTFLTLVATWSVGGSKVAVIHQVYPETEEYRCHYPAATLTCTFPGGPFVAGWYVFIDGIQQNCDGYSNHLVDATNMTSGVLVLQMNNTRQQGLENNIYSCTAVYSDGSSADSGTVTLPPFEDMNAKFTYCTASSPTAQSLNVSWDHPYKFCRKFTVLVNDTPVVTDLDARTTSYLIDGLQPSTTYNVTVIANELGLEDVSVSIIGTTLSPPLLPSHFCFTPHGIFICFVLPPGACCMCSLLIALLAGVACCRKAMLKKAKLKEAERNEVEPKKEKSTGSDGIATAQSNVIAETRGFVRTATPMPRIKTLIMMEQQSAGSSQTTLNTMEQYSAMPSQETLRM